MKKESKKFVELVIGESKDSPKILDGAIHDSKFHFSQLENDTLTKRKRLLSYKADLMLKWNFLSDLIYEHKIDFKKVDFWEVMEYFANYENNA